MVSSRMREFFQRCIYRVDFGVELSLLMWALRPGLYHMSSRFGNSGEKVRQAGVMSQFTIPWHAVTEFKGKDIGSISRKRRLKRS
jgi:hypothetical protein